MAAKNEKTPLMGGEDKPSMSLSHKEHRTVGALSLVAIMYFTVSGGIEGTETMIQTGGPLPTFIGIVLMGLALAVPTAMMTAELSTAFPENGGFVLWSRAAFGDAAAGMMGLLQFMLTAVDSALYPALFAAYLAQALKTEWSYLTLWTVQGLFILSITGLNLAGVANVGHGSLLMMSFLLVPFVLITVIALTGSFTGEAWVTGWAFNAGNWGDSLDDSKGLGDWSKFIVVLMWNMGFWERSSLITGEVKDVPTVFPPALAATVMIVVLGYVVPLMAFVGLDNDYAAYDNGYFIQIVYRVAGPIWGAWIGASQCVSAAGLFTNNLSTNAFMLCGMGEQGMVPTVFAYRLVDTRAPVVSIGLTVIVPVVLMFVGDFEMVLGVDMLIYSVCLLMAISSLIVLRVTDPELPRPFFIPVNTFWLCCIFTPSVLLCLYVIATSTTMQLLIAAVLFAAGALVLYGVSDARKAHPEWFEGVEEVSYVRPADTLFF
uniref:Amino acid permease/ SLC12A domain-containing protein n=2 Tax=Hemiselmis andersenii TaxID=464988 RepID=A0A6T8PQQ6_HEMAN